MIRDLTGYTLSKDHARLAELMKTQSIVCVADCHSCRDICQTLYEYYAPKNYETFQISARGHGYVHAENRHEFIAQCESANIEFIPPNPIPGL